MIDSERFGPCLLAWEEDDRRALMQLKERRLHRAIPAALRPRWGNVRVVELCGAGRLVTDFVDAVIAAGGQGRVAPWNGPINEGEIVMASFPPDQNGEVAAQAVAAVIGGEAQLVVFEGPAVVPWKYVVDTLASHAWNVTAGERSLPRSSGRQPCGGECVWLRRRSSRWRMH